MTEPAAPTQTPRRWFRFRLRTLLVFIAVVAVPVAWIAKERRQSQYELQLAERLRDQGFADVTLSGPYDAWEGSRSLESQGWWRDLAERVLGKRILEIGVPTPMIDLKGIYSELPVYDFDDVTVFAGLSNLQYLKLSYTHVSDLGPLARLQGLRSLRLSHTQVSDITPLAQLKTLQRLSIDHTLVSDLTPLEGLTGLRYLKASKYRIRRAQVEALQKALPECEVVFEPLP